MTDAPNELPLILLSGMGADERLFEDLFPAFPTLIVPPWIEPNSGESISTYAKRLVSRLEIAGPCYVGGASFGGVVAQEMTKYLDAQACFVISSIRSPRELPPLMRVFRPFGRVPEPLFHSWVKGLAFVGKRTLPRATARRLRQLAAPERQFERWATLAMLRWKPTTITVPVFHIHGDRDRTLPVHFTKPDAVVHGADHLLPYLMPTPVIQFIRERMK